MRTTATTPDRSVDELAAVFARSGSRRDRDHLLEAALGLADATARRYADRGEPLEDLRQVARLGLVKAADRYRPERGSFAAFATATVRGELRRHFRDTTWSVHVPRRVQELVPRVRRCADQLEQTLGRSPSPREIADELGVPLDRVHESYAAAAAHRTTSIDERADRHISGAEHDVIELIDLEAAIDAMSPADRRLLGLRFCNELTQSAIAEELGVSQVHISRLLARATGRMREVMAAS